MRFGNKVITHYHKHLHLLLITTPQPIYIDVFYLPDWKDRQAKYSLLTTALTLILCQVVTLNQSISQNDTLIILDVMVIQSEPNKISPNTTVLASISENSKFLPLFGYLCNSYDFSVISDNFSSHESFNFASP